MQVAVLQFVREQGQATQNAAEKGVEGRGTAIRDAFRALISSGDLVKADEGVGWRVAEVRPDCWDAPGRTPDSASLAVVRPDGEIETKSLPDGTHPGAASRVPRPEHPDASCSTVDDVDEDGEAEEEEEERTLEDALDDLAEVFDGEWIDEAEDDPDEVVWDFTTGDLPDLKPTAGSLHDRPPPPSPMSEAEALEQAIAYLRERFPDMAEDELDRRAAGRARLVVPRGIPATGWLDDLAPEPPFSLADYHRVRRLYLTHGWDDGQGGRHAGHWTARGESHPGVRIDDEEPEA